MTMTLQGIAVSLVDGNKIRFGASTRTYIVELNQSKRPSRTVGDDIWRPLVCAQLTSSNPIADEGFLQAESWKGAQEAAGALPR